MLADVFTTSSSSDARVPTGEVLATLPLPVAVFFVCFVVVVVITRQMV